MLTVEPPTKTGSRIAKGVARPVRPIETSISSNRVVFSSGGNLNAIAHLGARLVDPSRSLWLKSANLTTTPSIS